MQRTILAYDDFRLPNLFPLDVRCKAGAGEKHRGRGMRR